MQYFSKITKTTQDTSKKNVVLMGRNTWNSIPEKFRPLPGRINILVSTQAVKNPGNFPGCLISGSFQDAMKQADENGDQIETVWIIGGASIYKAAFESNLLHRIYLTRILREFECDTFLSDIPYDDYKLVQDPLVPTEEQIEGDTPYKYEIYERIKN